jgi:site-specific DNA-methyltransferase (adenine-specific)
MRRLPRNQILVGDARTVLLTLPADSVDCAVTSPPYFRLRNYQDGRQIGLEAHVDDYAHELLGVARSLARVLKPSGSLWLNLGDTFSRSTAEGAPEKSLVLAPERVALALTHDGWILRNKAIWAKTNPMPTSVRDRLSTTHEVVYFFVRQRRYFFDLDAIRTPHLSAGTKPSKTGSAWSVPPEWRGPSTGKHTGLDRLKASGAAGHPLGKNPGDVWSLSTAGYRGAHHAVFPERLVERPILATCPERVCRRCGTPWMRERTKVLGRLAVREELRAMCDCGAAAQPGLVLDPFMGSGTAATAARRLGRDWLGIELNPSFAQLANRRLAQFDEHPPPLKAVA